MSFESSSTEVVSASTIGTRNLHDEVRGEPPATEASSIITQFHDLISNMLFETEDTINHDRAALIQSHMEAGIEAVCKRSNMSNAKLDDDHVIEPVMMPNLKTFSIAAAWYGEAVALAQAMIAIEVATDREAAKGHVELSKPTEDYIWTQDSAKYKDPAWLRRQYNKCNMQCYKACGSPSSHEPRKKLARVIARFFSIWRVLAVTGFLVCLLASAWWAGEARVKSATICTWLLMLLSTSLFVPAGVELLLSSIFGKQSMARETRMIAAAVGASMPVVFTYIAVTYTGGSMQLLGSADP